jgi:hypothetical protein
MEQMKTKSLRNLDEKMQEVEADSIRFHILDSAKKFKTSWVDLGRALYAVWKDKLYKEWGFSTFDIYTMKEIGIRKQTAVKLLKSYYFLEKEEPQFLAKEQSSEASEAASVPSYEAIDVLRRAKSNKALDKNDYNRLKENVLEKGKDVGEVKKDLTALIRQRDELAPEEAYQQKRMTLVRRLTGTLKSIKDEAEINKILPAPIIQELAALLKKLDMLSDTLTR